MKPKILIVDDEDTIRYFLKLELEAQNYDVWDLDTGEKALKLLQTHEFDVVLLDLRLPGISGQEIMHNLAKKDSPPNIIIITAYATLDSAIDALRHGAHDYIIKPFKTDEILAAVADGIARKNEKHARLVYEDKVVEVGPIKLNLKRQQVTLNNIPLQLTPTEFDLLVCFVETPNEPLDSVYLLKRIRGYVISKDEAVSIVRVHIHRLRQKLETDPANPSLIKTVKGGRYFLDLVQE